MSNAKITQLPNNEGTNPITGDDLVPVVLDPATTPVTEKRTLTQLANWIGSQLASNIQEFDTSGTWTKPLRGTLALIEIWGAGASGAIRRNNDANNMAVGGSTGGQYRRFLVSLVDLDTTHSVVIGAGGASVTSSVNATVAGNAGGNTSFAGIVALGGNPASGSSTTTQAGAAATATPSFGEEGAAGGAGSFIGSSAGGSTLHAGPSAGGVYVSFDGSSVSIGGPGSSTFGPGTAGAGAAAFGNAIATAGVRGGAGGSAVSKSGTATSGAGGNGFCRVTVF